MKAMLEKLGFSTYKQRAYLALINLETASVGEIAKKANIPSSKIYETLKWLHHNGYISIISQRPLVYKAQDPKPLLRARVQEKIDHYKELKKEINTLQLPLPRTEQGNFEIIQGKDAFFNRVKEQVSQANHSIIAVVKHWKLDKELAKLIQQAKERNVHMRMLGPKQDIDPQVLEQWKSCGFHIKYFDAEGTRFTVWDGHIVNIRFEEAKRKYISLWIDNPFLGKVLTEYFDKLWKA